MRSRRLAAFAFLAVLLGLPFAAVSAGSPGRDPVQVIELSSSGVEQGLAVAFSPQGDQIAVGVSSGIAVYDARSFSRQLFIETGTWARSVIHSPDGGSIAAALFDGTARLWRRSDGHLLQTIAAHRGWVRSLAFSGDGSLLFTAGDDDAVRIWDVSTGSLNSTIAGLTGIRVLAVSPDDQVLAVGLQDTSIRLLRLPDGGPLQILHGHEDWVRSLAFSPDGGRLASGAFDATARLWDVQTGRLASTLRGHRSSVLGLAFSPDGKILATGSVDTTIRLWTVNEGSLLRTLVGHTDFVYGVAFSPNGRTLVSSAGDNTVRAWDLSATETDPSETPETPSDCRSCHHPRGMAAPPRVIQMGCEACHASGIGMNWCAFLPRSEQALSETSYVPSGDPVGVPVSSGDLAIQISYPTNGETLYSNGFNMSPVFVTGRVFSPGDREGVAVRMQVWSGEQQIEELVTQAQRDGSFAFKVAINARGTPVVAGAKAADPDCASCHEDFKSQASLPDGKVHLVVMAISPAGEQARDERWLTVDTSGRAAVDIRALDQETGSPLPGLPVQAATLLYEWRDRYSKEISGPLGSARLSLEALSQATTRYEISVPTTSLNGYLYGSTEPVIVDLPAGAAGYEPITIYVEVKAGQVSGRLSGAARTETFDVWAVHLPDGTAYRTSSQGGIFQFDELPGGEYRVFVDPSSTEYRAEAVDVDLTKKVEAAVDIRLEASAAGSIAGRLTDEAGRPLPFGWITVDSAPIAQVEPVQGTYRVTGLQPEKVTVIADVPGYYSQADVIDLSEAGNGRLNLALVRRPETTLLPWGEGMILLPSETVYNIDKGTIRLQNGWIWGESTGEQILRVDVGEQRIAVSRGRFAIEFSAKQAGWLYLVDGEARVEAQDGSALPVRGTQMVALSDRFAPLPVPFEEAVFSTLHSRQDPPLQSKWEPTVQAQTRDRLARMGISVVQFITFVTYMLVIIVIAASLIGGIYSTWKSIKS